MRSYASPTDRSQNQNGDPAARQILLLTDVTIGGHQQIEPRLFAASSSSPLVSRSQPRS